MKKIIVSIFWLAGSTSVIAQSSKLPVGSIEFISDDLSRLINKDAKVEVVAEGFMFTEGPLWVDREKMLLLSDIPGNTIYKWTEAKGKEVFVRPGGYTDSAKRGGFMGPNGLLLTAEGKLWICQHGDRRIAMLNSPLDKPKAAFMTVIGDYQGKRLNSPNDLFLTNNGDLYFTDPAYGFEKGLNDPKKELTHQGVYRRSSSGQVTLLIDSISAPNGVAVSLDGKVLIVSNSDPRKKRWYSYIIEPNGSLTGGRIFYDASGDPSPGLCDGLKLNNTGDVFASGPGGIWIFTNAGALIGKIKISGATASNCALTPDGKTLYITAVQYLLRVKLR